MKPSCEIVEYANTFLMSYCPTAIVAAKSAVTAPTIATIFCACGTEAYNGAERVTRYTPAVTIVAAWINAETGVGPAIASGSQTYSGICADLPQAPTISSRPIVVSTHSGALAACLKTVPNSSDPKFLKI